MTSLVKVCVTLHVESFQSDFAVLELRLCRGCKLARVYSFIYTCSFITMIKFQKSVFTRRLCMFSSDQGRTESVIKGFIPSEILSSIVHQRDTFLNGYDRLKL